MDESAEPSRRPDPVTADLDRLEALEQQVRQLTSRLAGWVEAQLVLALEDRRSDMQALRSEVEATVADQLAALRAEQGSVLTDVGRRVAAHEQLAARVDTLADRVAEPPPPPPPAADPARVAELAEQVETLVARVGEPRPAAVDPARLAGVEEQVARRLAELHDQVEARLSASAERHRADLETLRTELRTAMHDTSRRPDGLEQRVRAAMSRLSESVESKLAEVGAARQGEVEGVRAETTKALGQQASELRTEIANTATALRARFSQAQERVEALEQKYGEAEAHIEAVVETKLLEVVDRRRTEYDQLKWELQEDLATQLSQARTEIGTTVSDAHRRFLLSVERLDERMAAAGEESAALAQRLEAVQEAQASGGQRIEALELHTRRTDERLSELIEGKLAELAGERIAELEEFRGQLRTALDSHLADTRVEVSMTSGAARDELGKSREELAGARQELADGRAKLDERQAALDREVSQAIARMESLGVSVQDRLREAEKRSAAASAERLEVIDHALAQALARMDVLVAERLAELDRVTEYRAEVAALAEEFKAVARATAKAAFAEEGMLAPLRSDVRRLEQQVAALAEALAEPGPSRRASAPAKAAGRALPAVRPAAKAVAAEKAVPAKKAGPASKAGPAKPALAKKPAVAKKTQAPRRRTAQ